ncbi:Trigger factor [bioreactor metagenome]|uniref:Trigger factor n=1 Tax=bioreactor metagenome TaxID=1076179 RepID=A0A645FNQ5_9ZZZZ
MKKDLKNNIKEQKKKHAEDQMKNKVLEKVYEANDIQVPDVMVDDEISSMMQEFDQQLRSQGLDLQKYFEYLKKDPNEFREEIREDAHRKVKTRMLVAAVADAEGIEAPPEDVEEEIKIMAIQYKQDPDKIREMLGEENIGFLQKDIRMRKAMDFMFESAVFK